MKQIRALIREIHRRSLWQVVGIYVAGSWALLQGLDTLASLLNLPEWAPRLALFLLIVGFPIVVATAFVQEGVGAREDRAAAGDGEAAARGGDRPISRGRRLLTWRNALLGGLGAFALWGVVAAAWLLTGRGAASAIGGDEADVRTLAVLPFENLGDAGDVYFADGMSDEVRGKLTALSGFRVTARSSSVQYRQTTKTPQEIARELGVDYLLAATVRWAKGAGGASRVQVSPELIEARTGSARWQQSFDADLTDVFQVQGAIAARVAGALDVALGVREREEVAARPTASLAAYDAYLRAEEAWDGGGRNDPPSVRRAAGYFEQAVALDPAFIDAWRGLAEALAQLYFNDAPRPEVAARARAAAERAVGLAPEGPAGRRALAHYYGAVVGDFERALEQTTLGLRAAPRDAELLGAAAFAEQSLGRWEDALAHLKEARRLDPRSVQTAVRLQRALLWLRRYPEALAEADRALALAPAHLGLIEYKAMVYLAQGDLEGARAVLRAVPPEVEPTGLVAYVGTYWDLFWVLDDAQQTLVLRLPATAFDADRSTWASVLMQTHALRGDSARARVYADSARLAFEELLEGTPDDGQLRVLYGLALAYVGEKEQAVVEGERGVALVPLSRDALSGAYFQHQMARIYVAVGEDERALDRLEPLLEIPYYLSPGWLRIDPTLAPLRGHPRFRHLATDAAAS